MYFFLGEGERLLKEGRYQDALVQFLQAREANDKSPIPPVKLGDMFMYNSDLGNARLNYKLAADRAPNNIDIWSKYINVLIQSYEWEEAQRAMNRFRKLPVPQSAIDKAAADMYQKQGRLIQAQVYYRKAMARTSIDSAVYLAYAKSLMSTRNYKEAPFFFSLALRFDPLNMEALVSIAKCVAATDSIDRGISMLQDQLQKGAGARAELLAGIAELQIQKGSLEQAQENINLALAANPDFAAPFKLQAQLHISRENTDKFALDKALEAYQSYSQRNASDPSGYMERYSIFVKQTRYDKAAIELEKVYTILPKYPNLHYFKALLYSLQGNHKVAVEELKTELQNNRNNALALLGMGKELITLQDYSGALDYLNKAMRIAPQSAEAKQMAGYANFLLKNYEGAIALYRAALSYDSGNPIIYKRLGVALCKTNNVPHAMEAFRKYRQLDPDATDITNFQSCP
jgi:tetratricopeptide (TPR) repeat protein